MEVTICKERIYERVAHATLYTGAKHPDSDKAMISRVAVIDADRPLLGSYCDEAFDTARYVLRRVLESAHSDSATLTFVFRLSTASDDTQTTALADTLGEYIVKAVSARWLALSDKAEAAVLAGEAQILIDECLRKALYKRKPVRPLLHKS